MKNKMALHQILVIVITLAVIVVNVLANTLPINGLDTGQISDRFEIYFVPAGYVFAIWAVIYAGLIGFTVYQALPAQRENETLKRMTPFYVIGNLTNIGWIFMWHYERFLLTLPMMITIFITLMLMWLTLNKNSLDSSVAFTWLVRVPISLYFGWISVATIANTTQLLYYVNWGGFGISPEVWAVLMLIIAAAIAGLMLERERDVVYTGVFIWAYAGIYIRHSEVPVVGFTALVLAIILGVLILLQMLKIFPKPTLLAKPGTRAA